MGESTRASPFRVINKSSYRKIRERSDQKYDIIHNIIIDADHINDDNHNRSSTGRFGIHRNIRRCDCMYIYHWMDHEKTDQKEEIENPHWVPFLVFA